MQMCAHATRCRVVRETDILKSENPSAPRTRLAAILFEGAALTQGPVTLQAAVDRFSFTVHLHACHYVLYFNYPIICSAYVMIVYNPPWHCGYITHGHWKQHNPFIGFINYYYSLYNYISQLQQHMQVNVSSF